MSGALPEHRTPNRPLFDDDGNPVWKTDKHGVIQVRHRIVSVGPPPARETRITTEFVQRHVLDYTPQRHRPSKNAGGRTRPRTPKQAARIRRLNERMVQLQKSYQLDVIRMAEAVGG